MDIDLFRCIRGMIVTLAVLTGVGQAAVAGQATNPAKARSGNDGPTEPPAHCMDQVNATFSSNSPSVPQGGAATLTWSVSGGGSNCPYSVYLNGELVPKADVRPVTIIDDNTYQLSARHTTRTKSWFTTVTVSLPPRGPDGRIYVNITSSQQLDLFVRAVGTRDTTVRIASDVELNLSSRGTIPIFPGVQIIGTRSSRDPGPRLYTTAYPSAQFTIGDHFEGTPERRPADNVRISGIRLEGPDKSHAHRDADGVGGIKIASSLNVEIDNNEIWGWRTVGVSIGDEHGRINRHNGRGAVRIHDNYIHHNQQDHVGYGVAVGKGAYALIERNVFDFNRHAITGDGSDESGYFAYRNLILENGGRHTVLAGTVLTHTHQIDMHGQEECWLTPDYCGRAGEYMDIRYNTVQYRAGTALKLRGHPSIAMIVRDNVFAHEEDHAIEVTVSGAELHRFDNTFDAGLWECRTEPVLGGDNDVSQYICEPTWGPAHLRRSCDFDGDGVNDTFLATGATWWFASGQGVRDFRYLNTSNKHFPELTISDENHDGRCDVRAGEDVSWGGTAPLPTGERTDIVTRHATTGQVRLSPISNGALFNETYLPGAPGGDVVATGDFDGDGDGDLLRAEPPSDLVGRTSFTFLEDGSAPVVESGLLSLANGFRGVGDFDGNGADDVVWRTDTGELQVWKWDGDRRRQTVVSWRNDSRAIVGPEWDVKAIGDFNGDSYADIAWRHNNGQVCIWLMVDTIYSSEFCPGGQISQTWKIQGVGDFDGDGQSDLLWRYVTGELSIWFSGTYGRRADPSWRNTGARSEVWWQVEGVADFNGDGRSDILWRDGNGVGSIWLMDGASNIGEPPYHHIDTAWKTRGLAPRRP